MATKASASATTEAVVQENKGEEKVKIRLFKDSDRYSGDVFVGYNGKGYTIQRGVEVEVPKVVAEILEQSAEQDMQTANHITRLENEYVSKSKKLGL